MIIMIQVYEKILQIYIYIYFNLLVTVCLGYVAGAESLVCKAKCQVSCPSNAQKGTN